MPAQINNPADLLTASAVDLAAAVRERTVSAEEVLNSYLAHVGRLNPRINAIIALNPDVRTAARKLDRAIRDGRSQGPLAGVPFTAKDTLATAGIRTTAGSSLLAECRPRETAPAVRRLEDAGALLIGKTNCAEFALDIDTSNELFGPTLNPVDFELTPGGSSGGESAASAAGFSALGLGTDFGGSIRWPAQCTGVLGLRPTAGRVPLTGMLPFFSPSGHVPPDSLSFFSQASVIAPMARAVSDLWEALRVLAGPDGWDSGAVPVPLGGLRSVDLARLACGWISGEGTYPVREDVRATVDKAAAALDDLGARVVEAPANIFEGAERTYERLRAADNSSWMSKLPREASGRPAASVEDSIAVSQLYSLNDFQNAVSERALIRRKVLEFLEQVPILLMPVSSIPAFPRDQYDFAVDGVEIPRMGLIACCRVIALVGLPAVSIPCGTSIEGAPISVQVVGRPFAEDEVVAVAAALESVFGRWQKRNARTVI